MSSYLFLYLPLLAVILDLVLGDPPGWPHPVRLIGLGLEGLERLANRIAPPGRSGPRRLFGALTVLAVAGASWLAVAVLCRIPAFGLLCALYFSYAGLALGGLMREAKNAAALLDAGDISAAKIAVGMLVSRETAGLSELDLRRALAETTAENINDGFAAPFFYLILGGPPLLWAYKAVSTMDSMWGYKTERFRDLGQACARTDDLLAYLPARLCALALLATARIMGVRRSGLFSQIRADAGKTASPNAGWPMAAAAWVCGGSMGGPDSYFGRRIEKPLLGPASGAWDAIRLAFLFRLCLRSCLGLAAALFLLQMAAYLHAVFNTCRL